MRTIIASFLFALALLCIQPESFADKGKHKGSHKNHQKEVHAAPRKQARPVREAVNAPVMAHRCPFSCATSRIPKAYCKDWREGDLCFVQSSQRIVIPYRIVSEPSVVNKYYLVDPAFVEYPGPSTGEVIGDKIGRAIDKALP